MKNIIKIEIIKNNFGRWLLLAIFLSFIVLLGIDKFVGNMVMDYVELPLDVYLYFTMINVMIMIVLPLFLLIMNTYFSCVENEENGWQLIIANKGSCKLSIGGKVVLNWVICFAVYFVMNIYGCYFLHTRGLEVIIEAVCIPLILSWICFGINMTVILYICILCDNMICKVTIGILEIILVLVVSQTKFTVYWALCYAYNIAMDYENAIVKVIICVAIVGILWLWGFHIIDEWIKRKKM